MRNSFFTYYVVKANGELDKNVKATQQCEEINTKEFFVLTRQMVKLFDFLIFLKS